MASDHRFPFERLDVYRCALEVARWMRTARWPTGTSQLKDQGTRAADSMVLNIAEGSGRRGAAGRNHLRIAHGSAAEVVAVLDLVDLPEREEHQALVRRVGAMLSRMR